DHAGRTRPAEALARRAAAALERPSRGHVADRSAPDARLPGRALLAAAAAPPRRQARPHRLGADPRPGGAAVGRADRARRLVRRAPLAARRPEDPPADAARALLGHVPRRDGGLAVN